MNISKIRYVVGVAVVAIAASMSPASAETYVPQGAECNYGDASSVLFKENAQTAAWEYKAKYQNKGGSPKYTAGKLFSAARGTYRITYTPSGPKQKILEIHVRSSESVEAAGGHQCTVVSNACKAGCMDAIPVTPVDDLLLPIVPTDVPVPSLIFEDLPFEAR